MDEGAQSGKGDVLEVSTRCRGADCCCPGGALIRTEVAPAVNTLGLDEEVAEGQLGVGIHTHDGGREAVALFPLANGVAVVLIEEAHFASLQLVDDAQVIDVLVGVVGHADVTGVQTDHFAPLFDGGYRHPGTLAEEVANAAGGEGSVEEVGTPHEELHVTDLELTERNIEIQIGPFPLDIFLRLGNVGAASHAIGIGRSQGSLGPGLGLTGAPGPGLVAPVLFQGVKAGDEFQAFHNLELDAGPKPLGIPGVGTTEGPGITVDVIGLRCILGTPGSGPRCLILVQQRVVVYVPA